MDNILEEASQVVECKECPWYKSCVLPMRITAEDIKREMQRVMPGESPDSPRGSEFYNLVMSVASAAQEMILEACPIFVKRLKSSPKLAEKLKQMMQGWGTEEPDTKIP